MYKTGRPPNGISRSVSAVCHQCGNQFTRPMSQIKFEKSYCSGKCYGASKKGRPSLSSEQYKLNSINHMAQNNPNWKGGEEHNLEMARIWRHNNKDSINQRTANRRALVRGAIGSFSLEDWLRLKQSHDYTCQMCGLREPGITLTRDHIMPLSRGGQNVIENIQPLCSSCNSSKKEKFIPSADEIEI